MPRPKTDHVKLTLRLKPTTHKRIVVCAEENGRSLNSEIEHRLKKSLDGWTQA